MPDDDAFWERLRAQMPVHDCGSRLEPGGTSDGTQVLVCPPCSYIEVVDPAWAAVQVNEALLTEPEGTAP